jgi:hypothetical protein
MTNFKIDIGHDLLFVDLNDFTPYQPVTQGFKHLRTNYAASGEIIVEEPYVEFMFPILTETQYIALLALCGLTSGVYTADVTIYAQDDQFGWQLFNGTAVRPENLRRRNFHLYDVPILIKNLRDTA